LHDSYGINSGTQRAAKVLQRLLGLPADARMSDSVIAAVHSGTARDLIMRLCEERLIFLRSLRTWPVFGAGWSRRVREVKAAALVMANQAPIMDPPIIPPPPDIPALDISPPRDGAPTAPRTGASIIAAIISILAIFRKRK
jgi:lysozyme family protein